MTCPAILTGDRFITRVMSHIDCQAAWLGSFGWQELGQPGSIAAAVITGLLTLFIAIFGIRLLFGPAPGARDLVGDVLKIGIVLTIAFSWPAFRTLLYDVVIDGPGEIALSAGAPAMPESSGLVAGMQQADNQMLRLVEQGTGRQNGAFLEQDNPGGTFAAQALEDESSLGMGRLFFLAGNVGMFGFLRISSGFLLALAPLAAAMLLFEATRGLFSGWLRALVLTLIGGATLSIVAAGELAILLPWLEDALRLRELGYATPSAPTELLALTLGFVVIKLGSIWLMAKVAFNRGWITLPAMPEFRYQSETRAVDPHRDTHRAFTQSRSERLVDSVERQIGYESRSITDRSEFRSLAGSRTGEEPLIGGNRSTGRHSPERLGSTWRRTSARSSIASKRRDRTS